MILILILTTVLACLLAWQHSKSRKLPPGPYSFPIIGNIPQVAWKLWKYKAIVPVLKEFRKEYGDVFTLWLGPLPHVSIADYDIAHEVFVKNSTKFADKFLSKNFLESREGRGLFFVNGEKWQELRRFSMLVFRNMGMGRDLMEEKIMEELNARCDAIDGEAKNGISIQSAANIFDLTVGSVINRILMGYGFDERNKDRFLKFKHMVEENLEKMSPLDSNLPVWMMKLFFPSRFNTFVKGQREVMEYVSEDAIRRLHQYQNGQYEIDENNVADYVDAFILKVQQNPNSDIYNEKWLKPIILDLWITGQETTTTTLISGFAQLLHNPNVMQKVREELINATNGRPLSLKDKTKTPYFVATIAEIQRFASILNVNFWRINNEPTTVGGYPVDSGASICAQLSLLHTNKNIFKNPEIFDPERFIKDESLLQKVIPFGIGKRSCLGEGLAKAELYLIIGNLLLRYDFEAAGPLPSREETIPLSSAKIPSRYNMTFKKRV